MKEPGFPPVERQKDTETDPYKDWSDKRRMREFASTGDVAYINPELAHQMGLSADIMQDVPGATQDDIDKAIERDEEKYEDWHEDMQTLLSTRSIDDRSLIDMTDEQRAKHLLMVGSERVADMHDDTAEVIWEHSMRVMQGEALRDYRFVTHLVNNLDLGDSKVLFQQIKTLEQLFESTRLFYIRTLDRYEETGGHVSQAEAAESNAAYLAISQMLNIFNDMVTREAPEDYNALSYVRLHSFAHDFLGRLSPNGWIDQEALAPFVIAPGLVATYSEDLDRLYVCKEQDIPDIIKHEQDSPGRMLMERKLDLEPWKILADQSYNLTEEKFQVLDAGLPIEVVISDWSGQYSQSDIDMFVSMQREGVRLPMNDYFGMDVSEIGLKEQWFLFQYLKNVNVGQAESTRLFTTQYGANGLRTFLATEHDGHDANAIIDGVHAISEQHGSGVVDEIFAKYTNIVDQSSNVPEEISFIMRKKAARLLSQLVSRAQTTKDIENFYSELVNIQSKNVELLAQYQTLKNQSNDVSILDIPGVDMVENSLTDEQGRDLYHNAYGSIRGEELFMQRKQHAQDRGFTSHEIVFDGEPLAAAYTIDRPNGKKYVGGLMANSRLDLQGNGAGSEMIKQLVDIPAAAGVTIEAAAVMRNAIRYVNHMNFVITERLSDAENQPRFALERNDQWQFQSKDRSKYTKQSVIALAESGETDENGRIAVWTTHDSLQSPKQITDGSHVGTMLFEHDDKIYYLLEAFDRGDSTA